MPEQAGEKSQEATPHRREELRQQGHVARSQDFASALLLLLGLIALGLTAGRLIDFLGSLTRRQLGGQQWVAGGQGWLALDADSAVAQYNRLMTELAEAVLPLLAMVFVAGVVVNLMQVGFMFLPEKAAPDLSRIDPLQGLRRIFSLNNIMRLVFGILKIAVLAAVAGVCLYGQRHNILGMTGMSVPQIAASLCGLLFWTAVKMAIALVLLAMLDYGFQLWKYERDIRMTPQEIREELKNLEGNPQVIARRRHVQRQLALTRISHAVPKADVVITNPTEIAVAIQYVPEKMAAPIVVAKGAGVVAERIRKLAIEHGIPIVEKPPLARALYKEVEVNQPIPQDKYAAVAEVLAYVYQLKGKPIPTAN